MLGLRRRRAHSPVPNPEQTRTIGVRVRQLRRGREREGGKEGGMEGGSLAATSIKFSTRKSSRRKRGKAEEERERERERERGRRRKEGARQSGVRERREGSRHRYRAKYNPRHVLTKFRVRTGGDQGNQRELGGGIHATPSRELICALYVNLGFWRYIEWNSPSRLRGRMLLYHVLCRNLLC